MSRKLLNWWIRLIVNPTEALDLIDGKTGRTDHSKLLPAILLFSAIVAHFIHQDFTSASLIILGSLSFGQSAWRSFLKSRTVTSHEELEAAYSRRDENLTIKDPGISSDVSEIIQAQKNKTLTKG